VLEGAVLTLLFWFDYILLSGRKYIRCIRCLAYAFLIFFLKIVIAGMFKTGPIIFISIFYFIKLHIIGGTSVKARGICCYFISNIFLIYRVAVNFSYFIKILFFAGNLYV